MVVGVIVQRVFPFGVFDFVGLYSCACDRLRIDQDIADVEAGVFLVCFYNTMPRAFSVAAVNKRQHFEVRYCVEVYGGLGFGLHGFCRVNAECNLFVDSSV